MAGGARVGLVSNMLLGSFDGVEVDLISALFTLDASSGYLNRKRRRPSTLAESRIRAWYRTSCAIGVRRRQTKPKLRTSFRAWVLRVIDEASREVKENFVWQ